MATEANRDDEWTNRWSRRSDAEIVASWIDYQRRDHSQPSVDDADWWAVEAVMCLTADDSLRALEITFLIGRGCADPKVLARLGAGPLEDLLSEDLTLFDAIAVEVRSNPNLRVALKSIWQSTIPDDVWGALQRLAS